MGKKRKKKTTGSPRGYPPAEKVLLAEKLGKGVKLPDVGYLSEYEITWEPVIDERHRWLPAEIKQNNDRLYYEVQDHPDKVIPELLALIEKYPDVSMLYNFLSTAYIKTGRQTEADAVIEENFRRDPNYLFARLNYGELCLARGDYKQFTEVFDDKFDLKMLYPKRKVFHVSEVMNFWGIMAHYFHKTGQREIAERYLVLLEQIDPDHLMTKQVRAMLTPSLVQRLLARLTGRAR